MKIHSKILVKKLNLDLDSYLYAYFSSYNSVNDNFPDGSGRTGCPPPTPYLSTPLGQIFIIHTTLGMEFNITPMLQTQTSFHFSLPFLSPTFYKLETDHNGNASTSYPFFGV